MCHMSYALQPCMINQEGSIFYGEKLSRDPTFQGEVCFMHLTTQTQGEINLCVILTYALEL